MLRGSIAYHNDTPLVTFCRSYYQYIYAAVRCYTGIGHQPERRSLTLPLTHIAAPAYDMHYLLEA